MRPDESGLRMKIRLATTDDRNEIWRLVKPVIREGETYPLPRDLDRAGGLAYWFAPDKTVFVAEEDGRLVGLYYLRPNTGGPGDHICNCGYAVDPALRGRGIASQLCQHSLNIARQTGYRGMQYNLVVSTNGAAVYLWQKMGFDIVGTLPGVFHHPREGYVDAYVMFQDLKSD